MKNLLLYTLFLFALCSCNKKIDELPAPTQTGANTFGAKVNGRLWAPQGFGIAPTAPLLQASWAAQGGILHIVARNFGSSPTETEMELYLENVTAPGTFLLNAATQKYPQQTASYGYFIERRFMPRNEWITGPQNTGSVTITHFDPVQKIVSGTFHFSAASTDNTAAAMLVEEGRFDVRFE